MVVVLGGGRCGGREGCGGAGGFHLYIHPTKESVAIFLSSFLPSFSMPNQPRRNDAHTHTHIQDTHTNIHTTRTHTHNTHRHTHTHLSYEDLPAVEVRVVERQNGVARLGRRLELHEPAALGPALRVLQHVRARHCVGLFGGGGVV
jgi:hypothetical protein